MCSVDAYDKEHVSMTDDASSVSLIPMSSTSSNEALFPLGHTINFIDNWFHCFEVNYQNRITIYKRNMSEFSKTTQNHFL